MIRSLKTAEFGEVVSTLEAVRPMTSLDRHNLTTALRHLNSNFATMLVAWDVPPAKAAGLLLELSRCAVALRLALGAIADGEWDPRKRGLLGSLASSMGSLTLQQRNERKPFEVFSRRLKWLHREMDFLAMASKEVREARLTAGRGRGKDLAVQFLLRDLVELWQRFSGAPVDTWFDREQGEYRGHFWRFARAASIVCRELSPDKTTDGAMFSRLERLTRQSRRNDFSLPDSTSNS
jgi:hypothetical protein